MITGAAHMDGAILVSAATDILTDASRQHLLLANQVCIYAQHFHPNSPSVYIRQYKDAW